MPSRKPLIKSIAQDTKIKAAKGELPFWPSLVALYVSSILPRIHVVYLSLNLFSDGWKLSLILNCSPFLSLRLLPLYCGFYSSERRSHRCGSDDRLSKTERTKIGHSEPAALDQH